ncbi:MAG: PadR family transcriptional regulator [Nitrososphaerales archaeon]|nr:PadR family transcriptional regulator [Nitrososphaerales archaeon]
MWLDWSKRAHRGLRTWILYILKDSPKSGAEIMDSMEAMSQGWWRPSPGSVYPMLESMAKEGLIKEAAEKAGEKKSAEKKYELTEAGSQETEWPSHFRRSEPRTVEEVLTTMSSYVSYLEDLSGSQKAKLEQNADRIRQLGSRLAKLGVD